MTGEATRRADDREAQIAELRSLAASGAIDGAEYERRRLQIITPGAKPKDWGFGEVAVSTREPENANPTTTRGEDIKGWTIWLVLSLVFGGLLGLWIIKADWSGFIIGAVVGGGALFAIDVIKAQGAGKRPWDD